MFINIHTHDLPCSKDNTLALFSQYPSAFEENGSVYSIGIHPAFIEESRIEEDLKTIQQHILFPSCLAIGEIGLDKLATVDFNLQLNVFKAQLKIAEERQLPVIIHCVRSYQEIFHVRKEMQLTIPFIFHGFNKNQILLTQILSNNCIPSFGKNILHNPNLQSIFANLSVENFFLENDGSQIPIQEIYLKAAEIRKTTVAIIEEQVKTNFNRIFKQSIV